MQTRKIEIRWTDLDPNRHVSNSKLIDFMSHTRMAFLEDRGFGQKDLEEHQLGPIVFHEHVYYFREALPGAPLYVSLELKGMSDEGSFFEFEQNIYDKRGKNLVGYEMIGGWMDLKTRKITSLSPQIIKKFDVFERSQDFRRLTKADTRSKTQKPNDVDPAQL